MKKEYPFLFTKFFLIIGIAFFASCTSTKNVVYFQNINNTKLQDSIASFGELKIKKNDILSISIVSSNPETNLIYSATQGTTAGGGTAGGSSATPNGYQVDNNGNIYIYQLGAVHAEGLTRIELQQRLLTGLSPYLKEAVISVKFLNKHVTTLGEVAKPQVLIMPTEQLTILEALGLSGDITIGGRKDNVLLIRETETGKEFKRLDLTNKSIFNSPYFYLQPNDVVYVEPTKTRIRNAGDTPQLIGYVLSGASIIITILINLIR